MAYYLLCLFVFAATWLINLTYITVCYHRGLTHRAVRLRPWAEKFVALTGNWVTGLDPKAWSCMHRMHHLYADQERDPHSPHHLGVFGLLLGQLHSYNRTLVGLLKGDETYTSVVADLKFPVSYLNRKKLWVLPYILHAVIGLGIAWALDAWLLGFCYWAGMMSHPIQGWMVNSLGHRYGYRNFETSDLSVNNTMVAWLVAGEGYQNNHHHRPESAIFAMKEGEFDYGFLMCRFMATLGFLEMPSQHRSFNLSTTSADGDA